ncbi:WYL domain-containing protein [Dehalobacter sp. TBBPA1]|uniref:WYL domain-containing protein n=1 Tax=Dehalobacter sp. TBBPA1 TaxID=3235037 RepID=UPI0034A5112C
MVRTNLRNAIKELKKVRISYEGTERIVHPYLIGINKKGNESLRAYQVGGFSSSGHLPEWRLFLLDQIDFVEIIDEYFQIKNDYNPDDKGMTQIIYRIEA